MASANVFILSPETDAATHLNVVDNLLLDKVELDGVVDLDSGIGVTDGAAVVGDNERNTSCAELDLLDLAELVSGLLGGDAVDGEATLDIVHQAEVLARLLNADHIC